MANRNDKAHIDAGQEYGNWTALRFSGLNKAGGRCWECRCICGVMAVISASRLKSKLTKNCIACRPPSSQALPRHGKTRQPPHNIWCGMRQRCENPKSPAYKGYGGRGIKMCERWHVFENFWADMGPTYKEGLTIERIDNDGDYCPENCRWATRGEQNRNKRNSRMVTHDGLTMCMVDWAIKTGIKRETIRERLKAGWAVKAALETPTHPM